MKLAWVLCLLLAGKLSAATPGEERAAAEASLGSGYMMAFPMNDNEELTAEESAQEAVKMIAESLVGNDDDDDDDDDDDKKPEAATEEAKKDDEEPMGVLEAQLTADDEAEKPAVAAAPRSLFKRPKIEELRKILGFPPVEVQKAKPIPQEKPKAVQGLFGKPRGPKITFPQPEPSPLGGIQFNLRREDTMNMMRPFAMSMLKRDDRPFGIPDLVQAASSILRRAIMDDNNLNDLSKEEDDEEDDPLNNNNEQEDNNREDEDENNDDDDDEEESVVIVPIPDPKEVTIERPPLFRRFPIPFPFPIPQQQQQQVRPRLPFPPLTPVAFFLPLAQQIMQNIRHAQPRSQPPPPPLVPIHPMQHQPMMHPPMMVPMVPMQQVHMPILVPHPMHQQQQPIQRPIMRQMPRRLPMMQRRIPFPQPMIQARQQQHQPQQPMLNPMMVRRPMIQNIRPMPRQPMPPVHPLFFVVPHQPMQHQVPLPMPQHQVPVFMAHHPVPMAQQQVPVFHPYPPQLQQQRQQPEILLSPEQVQQLIMHHQHQQQQRQQQDDDRVILLRSDQEADDDDQEVLILVPTDEVEMAHPQRPQFLPPPPPMMRRHQLPTPVIDPLQRIRLLRDLLMASQSRRQPAAILPSPQQSRAARVVEIVQQQLRIFPAHHPQVMQHQRPEPSELHPIYVPYPGPQ